jgi:serine/threonine-protein kinase
MSGAHSFEGALAVRLRPGTVVGNYVVESFVRRGGTSEVYKARHATLDRRVALKVLSGRMASDEVSLARFLHEGRAAAKVRHPHVITIFDTGVEADLVFLVMEFVDGESLADLCAREGALEAQRVAQLMLPVVRAVRELHAAGIVHRDLKPANILLAKDRPTPLWPIVSDFGVARCDEDHALTASGVILGTVPYMAPEILSSPRAANEASDQYSLGTILYECSAGRRPFLGSTSYEVMRAIATADLSPPSSHNPPLPAAWDRLVSKVMSRDPGDRFPSLEELERALEEFAREAVSSDISVQAFSHRIAPRRSAQKYVRVATQFSLIAAAALAVTVAATLRRGHAVERAATGAPPRREVGAPAPRAEEPSPVQPAVPPAVPAVQPATPATSAAALTGTQTAAAAPGRPRRTVARPAPRTAASAFAADPRDAPILDLDR